MSTHLHGTFVHNGPFRHSRRTHWISNRQCPCLPQLSATVAPDGQTQDCGFITTYLTTYPVADNASRLQAKDVGQAQLNDDSSAHLSEVQYRVERNSRSFQTIYPQNSSIRRVDSYGSLKVTARASSIQMASNLMDGEISHVCPTPYPESNLNLRAPDGTHTLGQRTVYGRSMHPPMPRSDPDGWTE